jgi:hypothetical protein
MARNSTTTATMNARKPHSRPKRRSTPKERVGPRSARCPATCRVDASLQAGSIGHVATSCHRCSIDPPRAPLDRVRRARWPRRREGVRPSPEALSHAPHAWQRKRNAPSSTPQRRHDSRGGRRLPHRRLAAASRWPRPSRSRHQLQDRASRCSPRPPLERGGGLLGVLPRHQWRQCHHQLRRPRAAERRQHALDQIVDEPSLGGPLPRLGHHHVRRGGQASSHARCHASTGQLRVAGGRLDPRLGTSTRGCCRGRARPRARRASRALRSSPSPSPHRPGPRARVRGRSCSRGGGGPRRASRGAPMPRPPAPTRPPARAPCANDSKVATERGARLIARERAPTARARRDLAPADRGPGPANAATRCFWSELGRSQHSAMNRLGPVDATSPAIERREREEHRRVTRLGLCDLLELLSDIIDDRPPPARRARVSGERSPHPNDAATPATTTRARARARTRAPRPTRSSQASSRAARVVVHLLGHDLLRPRGDMGLCREDLVLFALTERQSPQL